MGAPFLERECAMDMSSELNEKFLKAKESISDEELDELLSYYEMMDRRARLLDSSFDLFKTELRRRLDVLQGFWTARQG